MAAAGTLVPELQVLYGLACEGQLSGAARFEARGERGAVGLSELVGGCLDLVGADAAGIVMVAESAGLVGASLRRSPALNGPPAPRESWVPAPFSHPEIRRWLSFTSERAFPRSLALVAGVAARGSAPELARFLRPLNGGDVAGHFHAAAFSYRPLKRGETDLHATVTSLFESEALQGVLHLLHDGREATGAGDSEFVRGACWVGPITAVEEE